MSKHVQRYTIERITIAAGLRSCTIEGTRHGLGVVGEPLRPYLAARHDHRDLALPDDIRDLRVIEVDFDSEPTKRGTYRHTHVPVTALGADDITAEYRLAMGGVA